MKRIVLFALTLVLMLLCACGGNFPTDSDGSGGKASNETDNTSSDFSILSNIDANDFSARYVCTDGGFGSAKDPLATVIRSKTELNAYCTANREMLGLDWGENGFSEACKDYDDSYFETKVLVLVAIWEPSCSILHTVTSINVSDDHGLAINIERYVPEWCDDAVAQWHIFVEPEQGLDFDTQRVAVNLKTANVKHTHTTATEPQNVSDPYVGYCGNTMTTVYVGGKDYSFMGSDSVYITDLLLNLDYDTLKVCKCPSEYKVDTEFELGYEINLSVGFARCDKGQATLTKEQVERLKEIIYNKCDESN